MIALRCNGSPTAVPPALSTGTVQPWQPRLMLSDALSPANPANCPVILQQGIERHCPETGWGDQSKQNELADANGSAARSNWKIKRL